MLSLAFNIPFPVSLHKELHCVWQFSHAGSHESSGCGCPRCLLPVAHTHVKFPLAFCSRYHPHCKPMRQLHPVLKTAALDSLPCKLNAWAQLCCHKAEVSLFWPLRQSILTSPCQPRQSHIWNDSPSSPAKATGHRHGPLLIWYVIVSSWTETLKGK